ncbi:MAG: 3-dehydroquinate synthase [Chloroflexi bacterium]|nr:3-dehydroquinate synthase [Chloroflexota bacterium]
MAAALSVTGAGGITYPVMVGQGLLIDALESVIDAQQPSDVAIITNETVAPLYGEELAAAIGAYPIGIPDGEQFKTLETVRTIYDTLLAQQASRSTLVVALGGGVVGDVAGFVAASFMRGVPFVQAPTTLLAMVDASLGGKVGVDLPQGKNLVGAFKDPLAVIADTRTLNTLPPVEIRTGLSEVIKHGLIADPGLLEALVPDDRKTMRYDDPARLESLVRRAMQVKIDIVEADRLEKGQRAYLNLGHTFAHALELVTQFRITHGQAVAIGLVAAAKLSEKLSLSPPGLPQFVEATVNRIYPADVPLRAHIPQVNASAIWEAMKHDKKWVKGIPRFVLLKDLGEPLVVEDVPRNLVIEVLKDLRLREE